MIMKNVGSWFVTFSSFFFMLKTVSQGVLLIFDGIFIGSVQFFVAMNFNEKIAQIAFKETIEAKQMLSHLQSNFNE